MYKLCFYIPETQLEQIKLALFNKGAGCTDLYDHCCWQVRGESQFRPLKESQPFLGIKNKVTKVDEFKVEMVCEDEVIADVVEELLKIHPYQQPAYEVTKILTLEVLSRL